MLEELNVHGFALIDNLSVQFGEGFNVLTGETGAGKSLILGALGLLFGQKADRSMVKEGRDQAVISGILRLNPSRELAVWLDERGVEDEDGSLMIRRIVKKSGRSTQWVQSVPVTRQDLEELTSFLIDIHGQHQHQSLLKASRHREVLDAFAGLGNDLEAYQSLFHKWQACRIELDNILESEQQKDKEAGYLGFALNEIRAAGLKTDEDTLLEDEFSLLNQYEKFYTASQDFVNSFFQEGAMTALRSGEKNLTVCAGIHSASFSPLQSRFQEARLEIEDIVSSVQQIMEETDYDPARLDRIQSRLTLINGLKKKYGPAISDVLAYADDAGKKLDLFDNYDKLKSDKENELSRLSEALKTSSELLFDKRKEKATLINNLVVKNLKELGMAHARFICEVRHEEQGFGPHGSDKVEFLFSANPGLPAAPLVKIASGGEISRVMLALKSILADTDTIETLVFDEIDTGIGGEVGVAVGRHIARLAQKKQILCITHLTSIAVYADKHVKVEKNTDDGSARTLLRLLDRDSRIREVSRMLSGNPDDKASTDHALHLLRSAQQYKRVGNG